MCVHVCVYELTVESVPQGKGGWLVVVLSWMTWWLAGAGERKGNSAITLHVDGSQLGTPSTAQANLWQCMSLSGSSLLLLALFISFQDSRSIQHILISRSML